MLTSTGCYDPKMLAIGPKKKKRVLFNFHFSEISIFSGVYYHTHLLFFELLIHMLCPLSFSYEFVEALSISVILEAGLGHLSGLIS